mgnify:CR=1 FL=1
MKTNFTSSQNPDYVESDQILVSDFAQRPNIEGRQTIVPIRRLNFRILYFFGRGWVF